MHFLRHPSPDYWVGLEEHRLEGEREEGRFAWRRGEEDGETAFTWRRGEEDGELGGGEGNGEDYDDCYCEDCVVSGHTVWKYFGCS